MRATTPISESTVTRLHPSATQDPHRVRAIIERVASAGVVLTGGMNRRIEPETAVVNEVRIDSLVLKTDSFDRDDQRPSVSLKFVLDGNVYFFVAERFGWVDGGLAIRIPAVIHDFERRDHNRVAPKPELGDPTRLTLAANGWRVEAIVEDVAPSGFGVRVHGSPEFGEEMAVELEGTDAGRKAWVRHRVPSEEGWVRLGLAIDERSQSISVERPRTLLPGGFTARARNGARIARRSVGLSVSRALKVLGGPEVEPDVVRFEDRNGRALVGILDRWGNGQPIAVVIPPAWGRTKETLLPLARTIVATFERAGIPVVVLRFDGVNKRGESSRDPGCEEPGREQHRFTFSQGFVDIEACLDYLESLDCGPPLKTALVTFSAASIDGRSAVARDAGRRIDAWIPVVGSADLQDLMRTVSGGVDFVGGVARGLSFGLQEILGVEVDIDRAGSNAIEEKLAFIEDSRRDFRSIEIPITWYHGRYDAWMDLDRIRDVMSVGPASARRRIVEVPTGHQLKSSSEALQVFQTVAIEIARLTTGLEIAPDVPSFVELSKRQQAERARMKVRSVDLRSFWHDYLLGPDETVGIEFMTSTSAYRQLMEQQLKALDPNSGETILDAGSGVSAFPAELCERPLSTRARVIELDLVPGALRRGRSRIPQELRCEFVEADIGSSLIPIASSSIDSVLASLLISYLPDPLSVLREFHRILRPGGRLVVSSLKPDADISRIYTDGLAEVKSRIATSVSPEQRNILELSTRSFLNDAARLLELEESGDFVFWSSSELARLVRDAGFVSPSVSSAFGDPPQATVVLAIR